MKSPSIIRGGVLVALAVTCFVMPCGCSKKTTSRDTDVLARIGDRVIRVQDLLAEAARRSENGRPVGDKKALLQEMVERESLMQRCLSLGLQDDPEVRRELDILLVSKLKEREIEPRTAKVSIPDAAIEAEYERRIDEFTRPAQVRLAGLMLTCNASATEATQAETRARLEEARRQIIASPAPGGRGPAAQGFGAVAINYTDDQVSRYRGGDLGWFRTPAELTRWPQEIAQAGFALKKGEVSEVLQAGDGFYLIMKADERAAQVVPLDTVRESLRRQLEGRERESIAKAYVEEAVTAAGPVLNEALLASVELPAPRRGTDPVDGFQPPVVTTLETNADEK